MESILAYNKQQKFEKEESSSKIEFDRASFNTPEFSKDSQKAIIHPSCCGLEKTKHFDNAIAPIVRI